MINLLQEINKMQDILGSNQIVYIPGNWKIFYEYDENLQEMKGLCILYPYTRLPYKNEYITGKIAEIGIFTFPKYRKQGVCSRLVKQAIHYALENKIDIVADCTPEGYQTLLSLGFKESTEKRVWLNCSKIKLLKKEML